MRSGEVRRRPQALRSWVKCREQGRWLLSKARVQTPEGTGTQQALGRKASQFKPGESGNPKGRPKRARNRLGTRFLEALTSTSLELRRIVVGVTEITDEGGLTNGTKAQHTAGNPAP